MELNSSNSFLGCTLKCLKSANSVYSSNISENIIIVSTCFFISSNFNISKKTFKYINELISNIESFQYKINRFTSNPQRWIYRVYIDETILNLIDIISRLESYNLTAQNKNNSNINDIYTNLIKNKNNLLFIHSLITKYIEKIKSLEPIEPKYLQIELYTYNYNTLDKQNNNVKVKLTSDPTFIISGHSETFGTLFRFHPLTDKRIGYVIMRNCSTNLTPLDIMIQNYWIEVNKLEYMEYILDKYNFVSKDLFANPLYETIYKNKNVSNQVVYKNGRYLLNQDEFLLQRVAAGLCSIKLVKKQNEYELLLNNFKTQYIDNTKLANKYRYGIDEIIIRYLVPYFRNGYKRKKQNHDYIEEYYLLLSKSPKTQSNIISKRNSNNSKIDNQKTFSIILSATKTNTCLYKTCNEICNYKHDAKMVNCSLTNLIFGVDNAKTVDNLLDILGNQYVELYNYIGTLLLDGINTFPLDNLPEMAILKGFDYKIKYSFILSDFINDDKIDNINISEYVKKFLFFEQVILNTTVADNYVTVADNYLGLLDKAYSLSNFKPLVIYPKNLVLFDRSENLKSIPISDIFSLLSDKHGLTFDIEESQKTHAQPNSIATGGTRKLYKNNKKSKNILKKFKSKTFKSKKHNKTKKI